MWRLVLALVEIARIVARQVAANDAEHAAAAKIFLKQIEKANAAIAKANEARAETGARARADNGRFVRESDPNSRD